MFSWSCLSDWGWGNGGDVDLSKATWLVAEKVPLAIDKGGVPGVKNPGSIPDPPVNNLFKLSPGTKVNASALGGVIDPTGTTILNDFDGDGILNSDETTTNVWVADYPVIEAVVAPPVTMKIAILKNSSNTSDEIVSEINSSDFESTKSKGSESIHQNELNLRTVQFQDSFSTSNELSQSHRNKMDAEYNGEVMFIGQVGMKYSQEFENSWSAKNSLATTTTNWADKPFKNNIDSSSNNLKSSSATNKAKKFRSEKSQKINETSKIADNAGYIRAALYIKNVSVNMPVKLKNILCSLMFETGTGDLIPVQSFRLRNEDYSPFEISVYGGSEFGPYVVQLIELNTVEIEKAIAAGYTPKIFIVDYEMTHVEDSNYKSSLLNFSGNNLKVIEENAKGRTGLLKIYGPNIRQMHRVAAFDIPGETTASCATTSVTQLSPGVTLKKALERLRCSGLQVEFQDYVIDLSEVAPTLGESKLHLKGIKSIAGVPTNVPCINQTLTGSDGQSRTACVQIPRSQWTDEQTKAAGIWAIYSNGKYYSLTEYWKDLDDSVRTFDPGNIRKVPMVKGVDSTIWAGDYFDIVYISVKDLVKTEQEKTFGTNPLETQREYTINTSWDLNALGEYPYNPNANSLFLGKVGFGEQVELNIKLNRTTYLTPDFGVPSVLNGYQYYTNFSYNIIDSTKSFSIDQVADLELSMGFGGDRSDWFHIVKDLDNNDDYKLKSCGRTLDFVSQVFTLCIELPTRHAYVDPEASLINLYLRPSLSNAYRRTIWPLPYSDVRKLRGELGDSLAIGDTTIPVTNPSGLAELGDKIYILGDPNAYTISSITTPTADGSYTVTVTPAIKKIGKKTTEVYVKGSLTTPDVRLSVESGFTTDWNAQVNSAFQPGVWDSAQYLPFNLASSISCSGGNAFHPLSCLGFKVNSDALNWSGVYNQGVALWNSWADASYFPNFLSTGLFGLSTNTGKVYRLDSANSDFILNDSSTTYSISSSPKIVANGNTALLTYLSNSNSLLVGRYFNLATGQPISNEFTILSTVSESFTSIASFTVEIKNSNVVIGIIKNSYDVDGFQSTSSIIIKFLDISILSTTGILQTVDSRNEWGNLPPISVGIGDTKTIISWTDTTSNTKIIKSRVYQLSNGTAVGATSTIITFQLPNALYNNGASVQTKTQGDIALVSSIAYTVNPGYYATASSINMITNTKIKESAVNIGGGVLFSLPSASYISPEDLSICASGDRAFMVWKSPDNKIYGQLATISSGVLNTTVPNTYDNGASLVKCEIYGNYGMIIYSKGNRIYAKSVDLNTTLAPEVNSITVDSMIGATSKKISAIQLTGSSLIAIWEHTQANKTTIRGRSISVSPILSVKGPGDFFVSTTNTGNQSSPYIVANSQNAFVAWLAIDIYGSSYSQSRIRGSIFDLSKAPGALQYGMNNFFIAPLIEREFTIWTKISN
ncbi:hypothetical protein CH371_11510 [Leptospira wolffii]|uniref:Uncharacterized protein n=1 Tax=Leptospira wolffii TaxID=409998 RepID=A0A2M9ZBR5_9LEPT|nr:hypothetical protein CH371_11510 [Leptospira wolffii]